MDILRKFWPFSFVQKRDVAALVINIIIHAVGLILMGVACWLIGHIPLVGNFSAWLIGSVTELYIAAGIVFSILDYCRILK